MSWKPCGVGRDAGTPTRIAELVDNRHFGFSVERGLFAMVANRAYAPSSKLHCQWQWLSEDVRIKGCESLDLHHLYRGMDFLGIYKDEIERGHYYRMANLFNLGVELVFFDTTSLYFEIDEEDGGSMDSGPEDGTAGSGLRRWGKSKNGRGNALQVVIGLAVMQDGFTVRH